jgi:hypothetical protein
MVKGRSEVPLMTRLIEIGSGFHSFEIQADSTSRARISLHLASGAVEVLRPQDALTADSLADCVLFAIGQPRDCFIRDFTFEQV